ncbi:MAG TPA: hypothetical protein VGK97_04115 [Spongiibacteraceae bacterium]|jgi:hypothetical protein
MLAPIKSKLPIKAHWRQHFLRLATAPEFLFSLIVVTISLSGLVMWLFPRSPALPFVAAILAATVVIFSALSISSIFGNSISGKIWPQIFCGLAFTIGWIVVAIRLGSSSFAIDDEIYSWNMWAIQHALGNAADFSYTQAPYPQLLPYWMGSLYRAIDNLRSQGFVRLFLSTAFLIYFGTLIAVIRRAPTRLQWLGLIVVLLGFKKLGIENLFSIGLADPLMAATLLCSVSCLLRFDENPARLDWLITSILTAIAGAFIKQPALLWGIISLPLLTIFFVLKKKWPPLTIALVLAGAITCAIWPLTEGSGFYHNTGVVQRSIADRTLLSQFTLSVQKFLLNRPLLFLLTIASFALAWRATITIALWFTLIFPSMLLWFVYGSYDLRLGLHIIGLMLLILLYGMGKSTKTKPNTETSTLSLKAYCLQTALIICLAATAISFGIKMKVHTFANFSDGVKMTIEEHYGKDAPWVIDELLKKNLGIFATSNYIYGVFYGQAPVSRPNYAVPYDSTQLIKELSSDHIEYAAETDKFGFGPASKILKDLILRCPQVFSVAAASIPHYGFTIYKIDKNRLLQECQ